VILGHNLGVPVVVEGVASAADFALVGEFSCDAAQGVSGPPADAGHRIPPVACGPTVRHGGCRDAPAVLIGAAEF
jgi:predicted signal transduction protein with EAL and GGDEF domain